MSCPPPLHALSKCAWRGPIPCSLPLVPLPVLLRSAGQGWQQSTQGLLAQLSGSLLPSLLGNLAALAGTTTGRRLQEQQEHQGVHKQALAGRFHQLRADRAAMRGRLRRARTHNNTASSPFANIRRLQEAAAVTVDSAPVAAWPALPVVRRFVEDEDAWAYWDAAVAYQQGYADGVADVFARQSGQLLGNAEALDTPLWHELDGVSPEVALLIMQASCLCWERKCQGSQHLLLMCLPQVALLLALFLCTLHLPHPQCSPPATPCLPAGR